MRAEGEECGARAKLSVIDGTGPNPTLPPPNGSLIPTVNVVTAKGWKGIKGWFFKRYQKKAGGAVPSANRITLLRDADGDGIAETRTPFLEALNSPFGMALATR